MESKIIKKFLKDHQGEEITKQEGNVSSLVWGTACLLIYSPIIAHYFKGFFGSLVLLIGDKKGMGFFNLNRYKDSTRQALEKYINNRSAFTELNDYREIKQKIVDIYQSSSPTQLAQLTDNELEKFIIKLFELLREWQVVTLFSEALDEEIITEYLNKYKFQLDFKEFIEISSLIDFESFVFSRDEFLLNFNGKDIYDIQWIFASYLYAPALNDCRQLANKLIGELGGIENLKRDRDNLTKEVLINKQKVEEFRNKLSGPLKDIFDFVKLTMELRDVRKKDCYLAVTMLSNSIREMFSRLGLDEEKIIYTIYHDFITGDYKKEDFKQKLEKRSQGFLIYFGQEGPEIEYVDYDQAKIEIYKAMFGTGEESDEIRGNTANPGYAKGAVKIVLSAKDFAKFNAGEILVTSMTRPEFVPLLKKAAAVVTDEGGLTCHAAIVSRELKKPCVVGTKKATNILKDNDLVEVDADKGIIKILQKS